MSILEPQTPFAGYDKAWRAGDPVVTMPQLWAKARLERITFLESQLAKIRAEKRSPGYYTDLRTAQLAHLEQQLRIMLGSIEAGELEVPLPSAVVGFAPGAREKEPPAATLTVGPPPVGALAVPPPPQQPSRQLPAPKVIPRIPARRGQRVKTPPGLSRNYR